jgi:DNA-binding XRE family transcriptional regulator
MHPRTPDTAPPSFVLAVRQAAGATQTEFAEKIGVGLRSLKRYEKEGTVPRTKAARRVLENLAKKHGIQKPETSEASA